MTSAKDCRHRVPVKGDVMANQTRTRKNYKHGMCPHAEPVQIMTGAASDRKWQGTEPQETATDAAVLLCDQDLDTGRR